jgi:hypothetical protein
LSSATATAAEIDVIWNRNPEPDIAGYRVRYSLTSGSDSATLVTGTEPAATLTGLKPGATYYCAVQAFNTSDLWSEYSDEISFVVPKSGKPRIAISLTGGPAVTSDGPANSLGSAEIGSVRPTRTFTVSNTGDAPLEGLRIVLTDAKNFVVSDPPPATIAPGASADFALVFNPVAVGEHPATARVFSNDPARKMFAINVAGTAFRRSEIVIRRSPLTGNIVTSDPAGQGTPLIVPATPAAGILVATGSVATAQVAKIGQAVRVVEAPAIPSLPENTATASEPPVAPPALAAPQSAASFVEIAKPSPQPKITVGVIVVRGLKYRAIFIRQQPGQRIGADRVQVSSNLIDWSGGKRRVVVVRDDGRNLIVRDAVPMNAAGKRHIRLRPASRRAADKFPSFAPPRQMAFHPDLEK